MKPAPRSGSSTIARSIVRRASPSSSASPIFSCSASSRRRIDPGRARARCAGHLSARRRRRRARSGGRAADSRRLTAFTDTRRAAPPRSSRAHAPCSESWRGWPTRSFSSAACAANAGGAGMSLATMASPPSSARASRASADVEAVGEEAHRGERGHRQHHRHQQQAQLAGAQVAPHLAPGHCGHVDVQGLCGGGLGHGRQRYTSANERAARPCNRLEACMQRPCNAGAGLRCCNGRHGHLAPCPRCSSRTARR